MSYQEAREVKNNVERLSEARNILKKRNSLLTAITPPFQTAANRIQNTFNNPYAVVSGSSELLPGETRFVYKDLLTDPACQPIFDRNVV